MFHDLFQAWYQDTLSSSGSLMAFRPELALIATIVLLLFGRMLLPRLSSLPFLLMLAGSGVALYFLGETAMQWYQEGTPPPRQIFGGMLVLDSFSLFLRFLLVGFLFLFCTLTQVSGNPRCDEAMEFYLLLLGATLGMCLMVSANHVLTVVLGMEMASVPSYVLSSFPRSRRVSTEAALKYAVFGAAAAGMMLFGWSLLAAVLGSVHLPTMAFRLATILDSGIALDRTMVLVLGGLLVFVGLAYKLSAFPFHFWAPDVFEGATAEIGAFLSIASKAAALALTLRLALNFSFLADPAALATLAPARYYIAGVLTLLSVLTCTFGNLAAYGQTNIKRLLAYSTIAHAGYMLMPITAAVVLCGENLGSGAHYAVASLGVYIGMYLFMNLAAFAGVAFLRNALGSEQIADYAGLVRRSPGFVVCMAIIFFSLLGLPPLSGFAAKVSIFIALVEAKLYFLFAVGAINTAISLFYYLRVIKVMTLDQETPERPLPAVPLFSLSGSYFVLLTIPVVALFFLWGGLFHWAQAATGSLLN